MGRRGPLPVPNGERLSPDRSRTLDTVPAGAVAALPEDVSWHPEARLWFGALGDAPQCGEYTAADWAVAHAAAAFLSHGLRTGDARWVAMWERMQDRLLTTRPARLAARLDVVSEAPAAEVLDLPTDAQLAARAGW